MVFKEEYGHRILTRSLVKGYICANDHRSITDYLQRNSIEKEHGFMYSDEQVIYACKKLKFPVETDAQIQHNRANRSHRTNTILCWI